MSPSHDHDDDDHAGHAHGAQSHSHAHGANARAVGIGAALTGGFLVVELIGGIVAGSLALIADAGHMLTDFAALILAWYAFRLARRPADAARSYGFDRFSVLAAFVNGLALFLVAGWIVFEALDRIAQPRPVEGALMLVIAVIGLGVNILVFKVLSAGDGENLNMRAAILHVIGDLLGSVAAIVAALVILATGWTPIDPILSVLVAVLILRSAWRVVGDSAHILLEGVPAGFDAAALSADLVGTIDGLVAARHLHAWSITEERPMVTLEAVIVGGADPDLIRERIKRRLAEEFGFGHATVEIHRAGEAEFGDARLPEGDPAPI